MFSGYPSMINEANCGEFTPSENPIIFADKLLDYAKMPKSELQHLGENGHKFLVEKRNFDETSTVEKGVKTNKQNKIKENNVKKSI